MWNKLLRLLGFRVVDPNPIPLTPYQRLTRCRGKCEELRNEIAELGSTLAGLDIKDNFNVTDIQYKALTNYYKTMEYSSSSLFDEIAILKQSERDPDRVKLHEVKNG